MRGTALTLHLANSLTSLMAAIPCLTMMAPCYARTPLNGSKPADAGTRGFQQTLRSSASTLDAISQLIATIQERQRAAKAAADPFRMLFTDVPRTDPAYAKVTRFQQHGLVAAYPEGYFSGARLHTRYEFAVALFRILQYHDFLRPTPPRSAAPRGQAVEREDVLLLLQMVRDFDAELRALGANPAAARQILNTRLNEKDRTESKSPANPVPSKD